MKLRLLVRTCCLLGGWMVSSGMAAPAGAWSQQTPKMEQAVRPESNGTALMPWQQEFMRGLRTDDACDGSMIWTGISAAGSSPGVRLGHAAIYDPIRDRMIVWAGENEGGFLNDVWELSLGGLPTWTQLSPTGASPSARINFSAIYDPVRDRMLVFGGGPTLYNDTWALSLSDLSWTELAAAGVRPAARLGHTAIYDPVRDRMIVFGGDPSWRHDTWALSLSGDPVWTEIVPSGLVPPGRQSHSAVYDAVRDRMVVYGGYPNRSDTWALDLASDSWANLSPAAPPAWRMRHAAVYDPTWDRMVVFGGVGAGDEGNETWALSFDGGPAWTQLSPLGELPAARGFCGPIYDSLRHRLVVFGGAGQNYTILGDAGSLQWPLPDLSPAQILSIRDVGNDQGRQVRLLWQRSRHDAPGDSVVITGYAVYRRQDQFLRAGTEGSSIAESRREGPPDRRLAGWDYVGQVPARGDCIYQTIVPTLCDSTLVDGICWSAFMISAVTSSPFTFYDSAPDSGYSLDNLAPLPPTNLCYSGPSQIVWDAPADEDLHYFKVYGMPYPGSEDAVVLLGSTSETTWNIADHPWPFYSISAVDYAGNEGPMAASMQDPAGVDDPGSIPTSFALRLSSSNPTRGTVGFVLDLPRPADASLVLFDAGGRQVRTLITAALATGRHAVQWDGRDAAGRLAGPGVYFARLQAGSVAATERLIMIR